MRTATVPAVSVVMPVHNAGHYLDGSIDSILGQTFSDFELVIFDDGSTDGSSERLRCWANRDRRIRLVHGNERSGPVASSNRVVTEARAPLIARMDADDVAYPTRLQRQVQTMHAHPEAVLVGALSATIDASGRRVRPPDYGRLSRSSRFAPFVHSSILVRRNAFHRIGGYRPCAERWEDVDLCLRLAKLGAVLVATEPLLDYRLSAGSSRLGVEQALEEAMDRMYLAIEGRAGCRGRLRPAAFVSGAAIHVWNGQSPRLSLRLWRTAALRFDRESMMMLAWAACADVCPKFLRAIHLLLLHARNWSSSRNLSGRGCVEWRPQ